MGLPSITAAGFWPGLVGVQGGHHWDVALLVPLPSRCAGNVFPGPVEDGIAVGCIPLQRCRLQRRSCPRATLIVAVGLGVSVVAWVHHGCTAGVGEGGLDPHISCSEEAGRAESAWRKRAGHLG